MATSLPIMDENKIKAIAHNLRNNPRDYALFTCGINLGLRGGDLLSLNIEDVQDLKAGDTFELTEQKTGHSTRVYFNADAVDSIQNLLKSLNSRNKVALFQNNRYQRLSRQSLGNLVKSWCAAVGLKSKDLRFTYKSHTLRKTMGYWMFQHGARVLEIAEALNHANPNNTLAYIHVPSRKISSLHDNLSFYD